jgi:hypothetical protein
MQGESRDRTAAALMAKLSRVSTKGAPRSVPMRRDGRHVLEPMICSVTGSRWSCPGRLSSEELRQLHKEGSQGADFYPLRAQDGLFFTESLSDLNPAFESYHSLVRRSIAVLGTHSSRALSVHDLESRCKEIQLLDANFASDMIGRPLDALHCCMGPDPLHPYSKITVCRTTLPVEIRGSVCWFYFEKFLVAYSYVGSDGNRRSTQTPIHSHPMNFETVYFASHGPASRAIEQEFRLLTEGGEPVVRLDGTLDEAFVRRVAATPSLKPRIMPGSVSEIRPGTTPTRLEAFDSELVLRNHDDLMAATDGLFRPHQVTVIDDPDVETRYFAIDNYFGPAGRVLLYANDGSVDIWSHDEWDH